VSDKFIGYFRLIEACEQSGCPLSWLRALVTSASPRVVADYGERPQCPVCARLGVAEERYLDTFVDFVDDPQWSRAYQQSTGLCLPHLLIVVERSPGNDGVETILSTTLAKWQHLRGDLARFVSKHEYRSAEPITEREATSYQRGAEVLAGRRNHFGNDMSRRASRRR